MVTGQADLREVIDAIAAEAGRLIDVLRQGPANGTTIELTAPALSVRKGRGRSGNGLGTSGTCRAGAGQGKTRRGAKPTAAVESQTVPSVATVPGPPQNTLRAPTERMVAYARHRAQKKRAPLSPEITSNFAACRDFIDRYAKPDG